MKRSSAELMLNNEVVRTVIMKGNFPNQSTIQLVTKLSADKYAQ